MLISTPNETSRSDFFTYFLNSHIGQKYFDVTAWGTAQKNISVPILQNMPVPVPEIGEQTQIAEYLNEITYQIDDLLSQAAKTIDLLKERRSALISAAVTGKIDVRGLVAEEVTA